MIKSFWLIECEKETIVKKEKIIPDGYPELIFHYKAPYKANISGSWFLQDKFLVAVQIRNHFYLENTGEIGMFGVKLQPWILKSYFNLDMNLISDRVLPINHFEIPQIDKIKNLAIDDLPFESKVENIEALFAIIIKSKDCNFSKGQKATELIINSKGEFSILEVLEKVGISERSLERYFKSHIGLSPKLYSRIIRFSNIFNLVQTKDFNWSDITYLAGFYDQSHFIKNFKEFTGEEPTTYGFNQENMANFFLKK